MNSPAITAKLLLINLSRFSDEKSKEFSRCRISKTTLKRIAMRERLREAFTEALADELLCLGWHLIDHSDTEYAIIQIDKIDVWPKIASSRISDLVTELNETIVDIFDEEVSLDA